MRVLGVGELALTISSFFELPYFIVQLVACKLASSNQQLPDWPLNLLITSHPTNPILPIGLQPIGQDQIKSAFITPNIEGIFTYFLCFFFLFSNLILMYSTSVACWFQLIGICKLCINSQILPFFKHCIVLFQFFNSHH